MRFVPALLASFLLSPSVFASVQLASQRGASLPPGANGGGMSLDPIVTPDGRFVVFASTANNFALTTNNTPFSAQLTPGLNVYVRDRASNTTVLVSVNLTGTGGADQTSLPDGISTNGQYVLFESAADNLVPGVGGNANNVYVRDLVNGNTFLVSVNTNGVGGNGDSSSAVMTPDGRYVAFSSFASDLVPGDTNGIPDVFVRDLQAGTTTIASAGAISQQSFVFSNTSDNPGISSDGRYVAFYSSATNLVPGLKVSGEIYVRDLVAGNTIWASTAAQGRFHSLTGLAGISCAPVISADGSFVAFLTGTNTNPRAIALRYCLTTGVTDLVNTNAGGPAYTYETTPSPAMTPDGRFIAAVANVNTSSGTSAIDLWDADTGTNKLISADSNNGLPSGTVCESPSISADGAYVAFICSGPGLTTNAPSGEYVYLRNVAAQSTIVVDVDTNGVPSQVDDQADPVLTPDGQSVVFASPMGNLVPGDNNHDYDVFLYNTATNSMELISARSPLMPCTSASGYSQLSAQPLSQDGRYLAFASDADNLVPGDTNQTRDVFVRDLLTGSNVLASVSSSGVLGNSESYEPAISGDGRYVTFTSAATNLDSSAPNTSLQVYVRDLQANTTALVSIASAGNVRGNGDSYSAIISSDGSDVLFTSQASNLVTGVSAGTANLYLRNFTTAKTVALTTSGVVSSTMTRDGHFVAFTDTAGSTSGKSYVWDSQLGKRVATNYIVSVTISSIAISPNGNRIVRKESAQFFTAFDHVTNHVTLALGYPHSGSGLRFSADSRYMVYGAAPTASGTNQVYLYDFQNRTNFLVSCAAGSTTPGDGVSDSPDISADGRFVIYRSAADNLVPGDTNGVPDVFLFDTTTGANTLLSSGIFGSVAGNNRSLTPVFSPDGHVIVFCSWASDLAAGDFNQTSDIFAFALLYASVTATDGGSPTISWPASLGQNYIIEYKDTLGDANWQPLPGTVTIIGDRAYLTDGTLISGQRYYRVRPAN